MNPDSDADKRRQLRAAVKISAPAPEWLKDIQNHAKRRGLDKLTMADIDAEIAAARRERQDRQRAARPIIT